MIDGELINNEIEISLRMFGVECQKVAEVVDLDKWERYSKEERKQILMKQFEEVFEQVSEWLDEDII